MTDTRKRRPSDHGHPEVPPDPERCRYCGTKLDPKDPRAVDTGYCSGDCYERDA